ncbi:hypothetical protein IFM89_004705 [Coptis chinensis]|uniref:Uncharacterized protein n=1 Tax=Coptis chinensis TaxID=261450 RepID=A0A835GYX5_9MAGN|nr:hypothetical protein IFM89_004705 [Coptis chinensis]
MEIGIDSSSGGGMITCFPNLKNFQFHGGELLGVLSCDGGFVAPPSVKNFITSQLLNQLAKAMASLDTDVNMLPVEVKLEGGGSTGGGAGPSSKKALIKKFDIKKWNVVSLWAWDIVVDNCKICRNHAYHGSLY